MLISTHLFIFLDQPFNGGTFGTRLNNSIKNVTGKTLEDHYTNCIGVDISVMEIATVLKKRQLMALYLHHCCHSPANAILTPSVNKVIILNNQHEIKTRKVMDKGKQINPGGSLGDDNFKVSLSNSFQKIRDELYTFHGYEVVNNLFFKDDLRGKKIAEFGCGHGYMTLLLSSYAAEVYGFDVDKDAIDFATHLKETFRMTNVYFNHYEGLALPALDEQFDCVISADVIEHLPNPQDYLREAYRVLKKDGLLLLTTPNGLVAHKNKCIIRTHSKFHVTEYYPIELSELLSKNHFIIIESYCNKGISEWGFRKSRSKELAIKVLCKLGLFETVLKIKEHLFQKEANIAAPLGNSVNDFKVRKIGLESITETNCDAILIRAKKS